MLSVRSGASSNLTQKPSTSPYSKCHFRLLKIAPQWFFETITRADILFNLFQRLFARLINRKHFRPALELNI